MTTQLLKLTGEALYGPRWQSEIGRLLGIQDRTVRAWIAGSRRVPDWIWPLLTKALRARSKDTVRLSRETRARHVV